MSNDLEYGAEEELVKAYTKSDSALDYAFNSWEQLTDKNDFKPITLSTAEPIFIEKLGTKEIQTAICAFSVLKGDIPCENVKFVFDDSEYDVLAFNKNYFLTEYEVKISRNDFLADAKKKKWKNYNQKGYCPNYFYYVCPEGLIKSEELNGFAGLIYVNSKNVLTVIKKARRLHGFKKDIKEKFLRIMVERKYLGCL